MHKLNLSSSYEDGVRRWSVTVVVVNSASLIFLMTLFWDTLNFLTKITILNFWKKIKRLPEKVPWMLGKILVFWRNILLINLEKLCSILSVFSGIELIYGSF